MDSTHRVLNSYDIDRIRGFLTLATVERKPKFQNLIQLQKDLVDAVVLDPENIPDYVVTMNSEVRIEEHGSENSTVVKLSFPQEAHSAEGRISLLAPLGAALLGRSKGDIVRYFAPGGEIEIRIIEIVFQPEAEGYFLL